MALRWASTRAAQYARRAWVEFVQKQTGKPGETIQKGSHGDAKNGQQNAWHLFNKRTPNEKSQLGTIIQRQQYHEKSLVARCHRLFLPSIRHIRLRGSMLGHSLTAYGLVGVVLANGTSTRQDDLCGYDGLCETIRDLMTDEASVESELDDNIISSEFGTKLSDYVVGKMIAKGCNAAVYEARLKSSACVDGEEIDDHSSDGDDYSIEVIPEQEENLDAGAPADFNVGDDISDVSLSSEVGQLDADEFSSFEVISDEDEDNSVTQNSPASSKSCNKEKEDFDLAVKVAFNYDAASNAYQIMQSFQKEALPTKMAALNGMMEVWENGHHSKMKWRNIPPHPNIVDMHTIFVGEFPELEDASAYAAALPSRLNRDGFGRNMTMFLVMKKYETTLRDFVESRQLSSSTACLLLSQLLEAILHMSQHGIAHRDLKSNNILLDVNGSNDHPRLVVCDFGCCLAEDDLRIPYQTSEVSKAGNTALMPPEIVMATPEPNAYLDYNKADVWTAGTLAYEIFGQFNPFYGASKGSGSGLHSGSYKEEDLPLLKNAPESVQRVVKKLLSKDPSERPDPTTAANMMQIIMWGPKHWLDSIPYKKDVVIWLVIMATEVMFNRAAILDDIKLQMKQMFLARVNFDDVMEALYTLQCV